MKQKTQDENEDKLRKAIIKSKKEWDELGTNIRRKNYHELKAELKGYLIGMKDKEDLMEASFQRGKQEAEENAFIKFRKDKSNWITFDDEIQKQIYYKIKDWKERGRKDSNTFFTSSIYRVIARLLEDEKQETLKQVREIIDKCSKYIPLVLSEVNKKGMEEIEAIMRNDEKGEWINVEELKSILNKLESAETK